MSAFGDQDPEDRYDASDPLPERIEVLLEALFDIIRERRAEGGTTRVGVRIAHLQLLHERARADLDQWLGLSLAELADRQARGAPE